MKKKFCLLLLAIASALCLILGISACGGGGESVEGTYYLYENDRLEKSEFVTLKGGKWTDDNDDSGTYSVSGDTITLFVDFFGSKEEFASGTVKKGVLTLNIMGEEIVYCKEGSEPAGSGGEQKPDDGKTQYTVTYNANGGAFTDGESTFTQKVDAGAKLTAPRSPARSNYTFAGWAKSQSGSEMWKFDEDAVTANVTLWAKWTQKSAVILSVDGASIKDTTVFLWVDRNTDFVDLTRKVVCSDDSIWNLYSDPSGRDEIRTRMVSDLQSGDNTYYIVVSSQNQAQVNLYTLTVHRSFAVEIEFYFKNNVIETETAYTGVEFNVTYTPMLTGYTFNHWKDGKGSKTETVTPWGDVKLYADTTAKTYTASLNVNQGNALEAGKEKQTVIYDKEYSFPVPTRTGYTFTGWYQGDAKVTSDKGKSLSAWTYDGDRTITAHWQANNYTVTVQQNDSAAGSVSGGGEHAYDSQVTLTATTNEGYTFLGWYQGDKKVSSDLSYTFRMGLATTYTARWEITHYTLTFVYDSNVGDAEDIPENYTIKGLKLPVLIGKNDNKHISIGWKAEDGTGYTNEIPEGTTGELTLTVIWGVTEGTHTWTLKEKNVKQCNVCGREEAIYTKKGEKTLTFGEYPQTEVTNENDSDKSLRNSLGMVAGSNPTSSNAGKWTDYGYYISGSVQSYMWYIDVSYQGGRYRGVYFTSYRPYYTLYSSSTDNSKQDDNGYYINTVYWFKYEPIGWRILEQKDGTALLMANIILDSQQYYRTHSGTRTINGKTVYPNNYKESDIRTWLTETFYETAFDESAKAIIETTTVDNSASSTASNSNSYACENTQDKVFLLSWKEILNTSYGFSSYSTYDTARWLTSTDYAKSQGVYVSTDSMYRGNGWWWLRSPHYGGSYYAHRVYYDGYAYDRSYVYYSSGGVVPALRIRL